MLHASTHLTVGFILIRGKPATTGLLVRKRRLLVVDTDVIPHRRWTRGVLQGVAIVAVPSIFRDGIEGRVVPRG